MIQSSNDNIIVSALRKGQVRRAVSLLLDSFNDELFAYCATMLDDSAVATVYQRALMVAIGNLAAFDGQTTLRAWLFSTARRAIMDHQWESPSIYPGAREDGYCPLPPPGEVAPGDESGNEPMIMLPQADRELLQLRFWHGLRLREVAFVVGRPVAEVRRSASEALILLSTNLRAGGSLPS